MAQDIVSIHRLELLHPKIKDKAIAAYNEAVHATPDGIHPFVTDTLRTFAEQTAIYAQGRTKPGEIVTYSKAGQSFHNYGLAIDLVIQVKGKFRWVIDGNWMKMINAFKEKGFTWGGDWSPKKKDNPHVQMVLGYTWQDLLALKKAGKVDEKGYVIF